MSEAWSQLLSSAMVGTDRRPCRLAETAGPLSTVLPTGDVSGRLLDAAAAISLARRAGRWPSQAQLPAPAPTESRPYVSNAAATRLESLLTGVLPGVQHADRATVRTLLGTWLEHATRRDLLVPPDLLVPLADAAQRDVDLRQHLGAIGGTRWAWLADVAGDRWRWAKPALATSSEVEPSTGDTWQTGSIEVRSGHLRRIRATDPAAGRDLLADVWTQERAAELAQLISATEIGLDGDDEPWLEKALDDRRVQVREAAAQLLARLPGSAYRQRMADRALACVQVNGKRLTIALPAEYDAGLQRDAVVRKPPQGVGERAWWMQQIVAAAPLDCWSSLDDDPVKLVARKVGDDFGPVLHEAWARAAIASGDVTWAVALCRTGFGRRTAEASESLGQLVVLLPADVAAELAVDAVRRNAFRTGDFLQQLPRPWPAQVCQAVLTHLATANHQRSGSYWTLLRQAQFGLELAYLPQVRTLADASGDKPHLASMHQLADILQIRSDLDQEFA